MGTDFIYCVFVSLEIDTLGGAAAPPVSAGDAAASHASRLRSRPDDYRVGSRSFTFGLRTGAS